MSLSAASVFNLNSKFIQNTLACCYTAFLLKLLIMDNHDAYLHALIPADLHFNLIFKNIWDTLRILKYSVG